MRNAFESCDMWGVVGGSETIPADATTSQYQIWKKKDSLGKVMITQCVKSDLVIKVAHANTSHESWNMFATEYSQTGSRSIMLWFWQLTKQLSPSWWCLCSCYCLSRSHLSSCQCRIRYPWLHSCSDSSFYSSIWSPGSSLLEQPCCWCQDWQIHYHTPHLSVILYRISQRTRFYICTLSLSQQTPADGKLPHVSQTVTAVSAKLHKQHSGQDIESTCQLTAAQTVCWPRWPNNQAGWKLISQLDVFSRVFMCFLYVFICFHMF